jgi:hypothetical protein
MPLILRLDIDKPYGRATLQEKLLSKACEDITEFKVESLGFLDHLPGFFDLLDRSHISSYVYFRNCSSPKRDLQKRLEESGSVIAFHAENTRSEESFLSELHRFSALVERDVRHFSKHGSGEYKLGKNHYPIYEEDKYRLWAEKNNLKYFFGNGMVSASSRFERSSFYSDMFWVEPHYRETSVFNLDWIEKNVEEKIIPIITHPENIYADENTGEEFKNLIERFGNQFITPEIFERDYL